MARFVDAIDLPVPPEEAFDYLADFRHAEAWDPGVVEAQRLTEGDPRLGSRFRVVASFLGRRIPLEYRISAFERPQRIVFAGGDDSMLSVDEITFAPHAGGTRVTYEARLELRGVASALLDPALDFAFQYVGRAAAAGLRAEFERKGRAKANASTAKTRTRARRKTASKTTPKSNSTRAQRAKPAKRRAETSHEGALS